MLIQGNCGFREAVSEVLVVSVQSLPAVVVVTVSSKRFQQLHSSLLVGGLVKVVWIIIRPSFFFSSILRDPVQLSCTLTFVERSAGTSRCLFYLLQLSVITQSAAGTVWVLSSAGNPVHSGNSPDRQNPSPERKSTND